MDVMMILGYALKYGPLLKATIDEATSNHDLATKIGTIAGPLLPILEQAGSQFFPKVAPELQAAATVMSQFDPSVTKWLQKALNQVLQPSPNLVVDGQYGPKTKAAVEQMQAKLGLKVDGWAGTLTQAAIQAALSALH